MTTLIALQKNKYIGTHVNKYPTLKYKYKYKYPCLKYKYKYKYPTLKYKYKYKYLKFVLEYWSSTSTSTKYYITGNWVGYSPKYAMGTPTLLTLHHKGYKEFRLVLCRCLDKDNCRY